MTGPVMAWCSLMWLDKERMNWGHRGDEAWTYTPLRRLVLQPAAVMKVGAESGCMKVVVFIARPYSTMLKPEPPGISLGSHDGRRSSPC